MTLVFVDNGESVALQLLVNKETTPENVVLRLYSNNKTPAEDDTAASYTEVSGGGYAGIALTGASWSVTGTAPTSIGYAEQTFAFTASVGNVYGYYVTRSTTADLLWAELFSDGPYNIVNNGDQIKITPQVTAT